MTKTELKKLEVAIRHSFLDKALTIVMNNILEITKETRCSMDVKITTKNYHRYIGFHRYGQDIKFKIYGDGNITVVLDEFCHEKHEEVVFEYSQDEEVQNEFLDKFTKMVARLINIFIGKEKLDFHSYMDFVSLSENMTDAFDKMNEFYSSVDDENKTID